MTATEITQHLNLTSIKDHCWHIQACCALTGEGYIVIIVIHTVLYSCHYCICRLYQGLEWISSQIQR